MDGTDQPKILSEFILTVHRSICIPILSLN